MNKYKVELKMTETYVVDVLAKSEDLAIAEADTKWKEIEDNNTEHYYQVGDIKTEVGNVYDVTNTDDPFNP